MSYERKFKAAVNVIRSLPKNGAYQPSHDLMLRFYAYYKQATEGPNNMPKPNFWELIKKAKWDAWNKLGNMSKEEAMMNYVEELKKIVETMSYTENVANFLTSLDSFYESVPVEDLAMILGPVIDKIQSQPGSPLSGSPLGSREASPHSSYSASPLPPDTDDEEDNFVDTIEQEEPDRNSRKRLQHPSKSSPVTIMVNGDSNPNIPKEIESSKQVVPLSQTHQTCEDVKKIMKQTSEILRQDLDDLRTRISALEVKLYKKELEQKQMKKTHAWWLFDGLSKQTIAFLLIWPFLVTIILQSVHRRKT